MEASKPDLPRISHLLDKFIGTRVWGVKLSVAWLSIELGMPWVDVEHIERGEVTLFVSCPWILNLPGAKPITSEMKRTPKWCLSTEALLENKTLIGHTLSVVDHKLVLEFKEGLKLSVAPQGGKDDLDEWTLFFQLSKNRRASVTLNGSRISHEKC